jgi:hypothetical protein
MKYSVRRASALAETRTEEVLKFSGLLVLGGLLSYPVRLENGI